MIRPPRGVLALHEPERRLGAQERAGQVHVDHRLPLLEGQVLERHRRRRRRPALLNSRSRRPKACLRPLEQGADVRGSADVRDDAQQARARPASASRTVWSSRVAPPAGDDDRVALPQQGQGRRPCPRRCRRRSRARLCEGGPTQRRSLSTRRPAGDGVRMDGPEAGRDAEVELGGWNGTDRATRGDGRGAAHSWERASWRRLRPRAVASGQSPKPRAGVRLTPGAPDTADVAAARRGTVAGQSVWQLARCVRAVDARVRRAAAVHDPAGAPAAGPTPGTERSGASAPGRLDAVWIRFGRAVAALGAPPRRRR